MAIPSPDSSGRGTPRADTGGHLWEEGGIEKKDVHVVRSPDETWKINVESKPVMKRLIVELAP